MGVRKKTGTSEVERARRETWNVQHNRLVATYACNRCGCLDRNTDTQIVVSHIQTSPLVVPPPLPCSWRRHEGSASMRGYRRALRVNFQDDGVTP